MPATTTATSVERLATAETMIGISASVPASPSPHWSGTTLASAMPASEEACQDSQLTIAMPQK